MTKQINLSNIAAKYVILQIHLVWCGYCTEETKATVAPLPSMKNAVNIKMERNIMMKEIWPFLPTVLQRKVPL